ncbi:MAG: hypothetical protein ACO1TE_19970 [Prosthecobacter sp.]
MSTNHDPFENELGALQRRGLPEEWKAEILGAPATKASPRPPRAPRWLVAGWGVAWAAILLMWLTTPAEPAAAPPSAQALHGMSSLPWELNRAAIEDLLAAN